MVAKIAEEKKIIQKQFESVVADMKAESESESAVEEIEQKVEVA